LTAVSTLPLVHFSTALYSLGLVESLGEFYSEAHWQRCVVHFYRNVFTAVPEKLEAMKPARAAGIVGAGAEETLQRSELFPRRQLGAYAGGGAVRHIAGSKWGFRKVI
jgi:hypothetical protein